MPKKPDERAELAKELYLKGMKLVEIASQLDLPEGTVRRWKCTHKWGNERSDKKKSERSDKAKKKKKKGGAPKGNHNATGPPGNQNARKHGLFSKYVQDDVKGIMEDLQQSQMSPLDILLDSIEFMYAKIIKAQQIMYVEDRYDISKEVSIDGADMTAFAVQYAWDKQDKELKALSRAFSELRSMMKAYDELSRSEKATEEQQTRIDLLRAKITAEKIKGNTEEQIEYEDDGFIEALNSSTAADWSDYNDGN